MNPIVSAILGRVRIDDIELCGIAIHKMRLDAILQLLERNMDAATGELTYIKQVSTDSLHTTRDFDGLPGNLHLDIILGNVGVTQLEDIPQDERCTEKHNKCWRDISLQHTLHKIYYLSNPHHNGSKVKKKVVLFSTLWQLSYHPHIKKGL